MSLNHVHKIWKKLLHIVGIAMLCSFMMLIVVSCYRKNAVGPGSNNLNTVDEEVMNIPPDSAAWWDTNTIYYFQQQCCDEDGNDTIAYQKKHLRTGQGSNLITTDSVWGRAFFDLKRKNITFDVDGYMDRDSVLLDSIELNSTTWNYSVEDTFFRYESNTTLGTLTPYKGR